MIMQRCPWVPEGNEIYAAYHDTEWGVPSRDARYLFEMLCLEGAQAGLSWWTVLRKRDRYREQFHHFNVEKMARMTDPRLEKILTDPGIIRHRGKVWGFRQNARAWIDLADRTGDPVEWLWSFVDGRTKVRRPRVMADYAVNTPQSDAMSKALRKAGFNFVGSTIIHAYMQAVGMVDEHSATCFRAKGGRK